MPRKKKGKQRKFKDLHSRKTQEVNLWSVDDFSSPVNIEIKNLSKKHILCN